MIQVLLKCCQCGQDVCVLQSDVPTPMQVILENMRVFCLGCTDFGQKKGYIEWNAGVEE